MEALERVLREKGLVIEDKRTVSKIRNGAGM